MLGEGFEPPKAEPSDLQSDVFDRFTTPAHGADRGTRTHDPRFTKPLLYQLSYVGALLSIVLHFSQLGALTEI